MFHKAESSHFHVHYLMSAEQVLPMNKVDVLREPPMQTEWLHIPRHIFFLLGTNFKVSITEDWLMQTK